LKVGTTSFVGQPDAMSEALDSQLKFTKSGTWWIASGEADQYYYEADAAQSETNRGTPYIFLCCSCVGEVLGWGGNR